MRDSATIHVSNAVAEAAAERIAPPRKRVRLASVRVSPGGYLGALCAVTFISAQLLRSEFELAAMSLFAFAWLIIPILALTDRVVFDGQGLARRGLVPALFSLATGRGSLLAVDDIEGVETMAVRTLRRGGRVRYRYRSEVTGRGLRFIFASGGGSYRKMVRTLFSVVPEVKLDARSMELMHYLTDRKNLNAKVAALQLASTDVLEGATADLKPGARKTVRHQRTAQQSNEVDFERGTLLRTAANELRASGRLRQSSEAFRRALLVFPGDAWLLYEFGRLLRSQASAMSDARLLTRARAALRLASRRASSDTLLLSRIGESFFEYGDLVQASLTFHRALAIDPFAYRAEIGLAEIALRNGKLAHVIHHYAGAARIAPDEALVRMARREADYYARLNDDDDYLATELRRISWLQHVQLARRLSIRIAFASVLLALVGSSIDESIANTGWALATSSIVAWMFVAVAEKLLRPRGKAQTLD